METFFDFKVSLINDVSQTFAQFAVLSSQFANCRLETANRFRTFAEN